MFVKAACSKKEECIICPIAEEVFDEWEDYESKCSNFIFDMTLLCPAHPRENIIQKEDFDVVRNICTLCNKEARIIKE